MPPKIALLGWTYSPVAVWRQHPMFSPRRGAHVLVRADGKFLAGGVCLGRTALGLCVGRCFLRAVVHAADRPRGRRTGFAFEPRQAQSQTRMLWLRFWSFASLVAFLGVLLGDLRFRRFALPFAAAPVLHLGPAAERCADPVSLLYVFGLDRLLGRSKHEPLKFLVLAAIVALMSASEGVVNAPAFASEYNWFHMVRWRQ